MSDTPRSRTDRIRFVLNVVLAAGLALFSGGCTIMWIVFFVRGNNVVMQGISLLGAIACGAFLALTNRSVEEAVTEWHGHGRWPGRRVTIGVRILLAGGACLVGAAFLLTALRAVPSLFTGGTPWWDSVATLIGVGVVGVVLLVGGWNTWRKGARQWRGLD